MPDQSLIPAIKAALRANEIGNSSPYKLSFAGKGTSGASFGIYQADTNTNHNAGDTLRNVLAAAGMAAAAVDRILKLLIAPCPTNPLSDSETAAVNAALDAPQGRALVDTLDDKSLSVVLGHLDHAVAAAAKAANSVVPEAQLAICLWCNMTGAPTTLSKWLGGDAVTMGGSTVHAPANPVSFAEMERFLKNAKFFKENPRTWAHFNESVSVGSRSLT
jgi:hypothetical protein